MAASATFTYNGSNEVVATITGATPGDDYTLLCEDPDSTVDSANAVTSTVVLTVSDVGGLAAGQTFDAYVFNVTTNATFAVTIFKEGETAEFDFDQDWDYDGGNDVTVTFDSVLGVDYTAWIFDDASAYNSGSVPGTGASLTIPITAGGDFGGAFIGVLYHTDAPFESFASRVFVQNIPGAGSPGNPGGGPPPVPSGVIVTLDGTDVTQCCVAGNWTRRLNRPSTAQIRVPMDCTTAPVGSLLKIEALVGTTYEIVHHGRVLLVETDTTEDFGYTTYNSTDPMEMWQWRPVRDNDCDFSDPQIISEYLTGPAIIEAALNNSIDCGDSSQADCEGSLFLTVNAAASGGVDLTGAPTDWPMTIAELTSLLVSTGEVDVVITPTDPGGGIMGEVDFYNGDYGQDLSATVVFSYGMGDYNVRRVRWNQDMTTMVNKLWYYGGPKIATAADPAAVQHWCYNITGDDPDLAYPPGGALSPPASSTDNQLGVLRVASEAAYGVRMDIQIFDAYDECAGVGTVGRDLYRYRWQQESWLRAQPREIIHVTPTRGTEIGTFDIGDLVTVEATAAVRGGFSGVQRVYEYTVSWDQDGVLELSELQTSADNEGL